MISTKKILTDMKGLIMKKFLIVSMLLAAGLKMQACTSESPTHNKYMFSVFNRKMMSNTFSKRINEIWKNYTHGRIEDYDVEKLVYVTPSEFYKSDNKIINFAQQRGDAEMTAYLKLLTNYLNVCNSYVQDKWNYPSKRDLINRHNRLVNINQQARIYRGSRLKQQYTLLTMRSYFLLKNYTSCENYWNSNAVKTPQSVYKDMMRDLYAGTLVKRGLTDKACDIYAELNDLQSVKWCMRKNRNIEGIKKMYVNNPNSPTLPYLVQDFVNNTQETLDDNSNDNAEWFKTIDVNPIYRKEVEQFIRFADNVVNEGKTKTPILWQTATAYLNFLFGKKQMALNKIDRAMAMKGTMRMKDNARAIKLLIYIGTAKNTTEFSDYLSSEIKWLQLKEKEDGREIFDYQNHYTDVIDRIVYNNLIPLYERWGKTNTATALFSVIHDMYINENYADIRSQKNDKISDYRWNYDYQGDYFDRLDTMNVENLKSYVSYIGSVPKNNFEKWILNNVYKDTDYYNDLIGTKLMRLCRYDEAIGYLEKVSMSFLQHQNISGYMSGRNFSVERWIKHQKMENMDGPDKMKPMAENPKIEFCRSMKAMENQYQFLSNNEDRKQKAYDMGVRYYQASYLGDCWYLTRYSHSIMDSARVNETNFVRKAIDYLNISKTSSNFDLKEKSLYALAYIPEEPWGGFFDMYENKFNTENVNTASRQYHSLIELALFAKNNQVSEYVSKCDVLKRFINLGKK
jgi:hypothetical protein